MTSAQRLREFQLIAESEESTAAYPRTLETLLRQRYPAQSITVTNEGRSGESVVDGKERLATLGQADVLLLMEGINDLNNGGDESIPRLISALHSMVTQGQARGMKVFLGNLLPQRLGACRQYSCPDVILAANGEIKSLAARDGAVLVNVYAAFEGHTGELLGLDGLHPNEAGYRKIAEEFFDAAIVLESR